jgi:2-C-methyl-D-erythritol 2,4-cyclodiphosphate synthase
VGEGIDRHRLVAGRRLMLAGVEIEHSHGLAGHSDGDAVLHALCDALLGALALGDLGRLFSDEAEENRDRASADFLQAVMERVIAAGYRLGNADLSIMAEAPRLAPHVEAMRANVARLCGCEPHRISIKATRGEGLGPEGRDEAITVRAVVLVEGESS